MLIKNQPIDCTPGMRSPNGGLKKSLIISCDVHEIKSGAFMKNVGENNLERVTKQEADTLYELY